MEEVYVRWKRVPVDGEGPKPADYLLHATGEHSIPGGPRCIGRKPRGQYFFPVMKVAASRGGLGG